MKGFERTIDSADRDRQAAELRAQGWTYDRIGNELGFNDRSAARKAVQRALAATVREAGDELRVLELERLDRLWEKAWEVLDRVHYAHSQGRVIKLDGVPLLDDGPMLAGLDRLLKIQERRAKLLGLDAPVKHEVWTIDAINAELERLDAQLAARAAQDQAAGVAGEAQGS